MWNDCNVIVIFSEIWIFPPFFLVFVYEQFFGRNFLNFKTLIFLGYSTQLEDKNDSNRIFGTRLLSFEQPYSW
jgi:hypothetical protein